MTRMAREPRVSAIIPAAGAGRRLGARVPKAFVKISGKNLLTHTLSALQRSFSFCEIFVVCPPGRTREAARLYRFPLYRVIPGGKTRAESVRKAVEAASGEYVLVHDAARPFISRELVQKVIRAAFDQGAAIVAEPVHSTVKRVRGGCVVGTEDRRELYLAQTPQVFKRSDLIRRYARLGGRYLRATDEAQLFDGTPNRIEIVEGTRDNLKITSPEDLRFFKWKNRNRSKKATGRCGRGGL